MGFQRLARIRCHLQGTDAAAVHSALSAPLPERCSAVTVTPAELTESQIVEYNTKGFLVLRNAIDPHEHAALAERIHSAFRNGIMDDYGDHHAKGIHYPNPKVRYDHGSLLLEKDPEVARLSLDQPTVVKAVEQLLQGPAVISQWRTYINPPGFSTERVTGRPYQDGRGAHYDCKPWRPAGSFLDWMFAVIPLCDYLPHVGPMRAGPWDLNNVKNPCTVLPSDGRVHKFAVNRMPPLENIKMQDPSLRCGDVILMSGYCWHEACPNFTEDIDRFGIYQKYHAKATPPAVGPWVHPTSTRKLLRHPHLMPYTRGDGRVAATTYADGTQPYFPDRAPVLKGRVDAKMPVVDVTQLVLEDRSSRVLLVRDASGNWGLPGCDAVETKGGDNLDCGNVIGCLTDHVSDTLGVAVPWMSWIHDHVVSAGSADHLTRVYGTRLEPAFEAAAVRAASSVGAKWASAAELAQLVGPDVAQWVRMWQEQIDEDGLPVRRTYGYRGEYGRYFSHLNPGNPLVHGEGDTAHAGMHVIGEHDEEGLPLRGPQKVPADPHSHAVLLPPL